MLPAMGSSPPGRHEAIAEYRALLAKAQPSARDMRRLKVLLGRFRKSIKDATRDRELLRQLRDLRGSITDPDMQLTLEGLQAGDVEQIQRLLGDAEFHRLGEQKARQLVADLLG